MEENKSKKTRPSKGLADILQSAELIAAGLKANTTEVSKRGVDTEFINNLEQTIKDIHTLEVEQEKLKADMKLKTEAINTKVDSLSKKISESKKVIKLAMPQPQWVEFGIKDKR